MSLHAGASVNAGASTFTASGAARSMAEQRPGQCGVGRSPPGAAAWARLQPKESRPDAPGAAPGGSLSVLSEPWRAAAAGLDGLSPQLSRRDGAESIGTLRVSPPLSVATERQAGEGWVGVSPYPASLSHATGSRRCLRDAVAFFHDGACSRVRAQSKRVHTARYGGCFTAEFKAPSPRFGVVPPLAGLPAAAPRFCRDERCPVPRRVPSTRVEAATSRGVSEVLRAPGASRCGGVAA